MEPHADRRVDLIVIGLGAMGASVTLQAARQGMSVLGLDRYDPPHTFGSSHAETRISRLSVGEGPQYLPYAARSHQLWREMEAETGTELMHECGGLIVTSPTTPDDRWVDFAVASSEIAAGEGIAFSLHTAAEARSRYPQLLLADDATVGFEPSGALVMVERAVATQIALARASGAQIQTGETVTAIDPGSSTVTVTTDRGRYVADHVVNATGPWVGDFGSDADRARTRVTRQVVYWFETEEPALWTTDRMPFVMWIGASIEDYLCVFPGPPGASPGIKMMGEQFAEPTTPHEVDRTVSAEEIAAFHAQHVAPKLEGVTDRCLKTEVCLYTNTPDEHFLIDQDPRSERVTVVSACSGHGFKHSPALGEALAQRLATGRSTLDLSPFARSERTFA